MAKMKSIPVNIWDDYCEDDCETYMYIEEYDDMDDQKKTEAMRVVLAHLKTLDLTGVEDAGDEIHFSNLPHERREKLVTELDAAKLEWNGIPFSFYSES